MPDGNVDWSWCALVARYVICVVARTSAHAASAELEAMGSGIDLVAQTGERVCKELRSIRIALMLQTLGCPGKRMKISETAAMC